MLKAALAAGALLPAIPATAQDWIEIAGFGGTGEDATSFVFIDASRIKSVGSRQYAAPFLEVTSKHYVERTVTVSCNLKLEFAASQWRDRRGGKAFDARATSQKLLGHAAGAMGGSFGAQVEPPRKQDLQLGRWLCDAARPVSDGQFIRRAGDPKAAAWRLLDANRARVPGKVNAQLAQAASSLTYVSPQQSYSVRSLRAEGCDLKLVTGTGLNIRLSLRYLRPRRGGETRLTFTNFDTNVTEMLSGLPADLADPIGYSLNSLKSDC